MARKGLYGKFNQFLEAYAPHGLYGRALLIMITPVVLLQILMTGIIIERYWDNVTKVLARSLSNEIGLLISLYERSDRTEAALNDIKKLAQDRLRMNFAFERGNQLPAPLASPFFSLFDSKIKHYLSVESDHPYWVNSAASNGQVEIRVQVTEDLIFKTTVDADRAHAVGTPLMLSIMVLSTLSILGIAVVFMRNQIRPILDLTKAAQAFGKGREIGAFRPRGAREVRLAGEAFVDMKRRIARYVEQRTTMLAGVSHDLRTILTRFKLELAVLGDHPKAKPLREDVIEMQQMLEDYIAFVRGDEGEAATKVNVSDLIRATTQSLARGTSAITIGNLPIISLYVKPNSFKRMLNNIVGNALRYGTAVLISGEVKDERFWLYVDDDGPGIPVEKREDVFRPFVRLDEARNLDKSGTGLGLAIALDVALAHGGDIFLEDGSLGGLRVIIKIPT